METTDLTLFGDTNLGLVAAIVICFLGYVVYNFMTIIATDSVKKFKDIKLSKWWGDNQIVFVLSLLLGAILFYVKYINDDMTIDGMFFVGMGSNFMVKYLFKAFSKSG